MIREKKVTILLKDEVNCAVLGLTEDHIDVFHNEFGLKAPNYYFSPKFTLGEWDGYIRFFNKRGATYIHLLPQIVPLLRKLDYKIKLDDRRKALPVFPDPIDENFFAHLIDTRTNQPWIMRDYQIEFVNALLAEGTGIGVAGTGAGKTSICAAIALSYERAAGLKSIIIVPDKNLTSQTFREYQFFGLDVGQYSGEVKDIDHQHVVSTWQSLNNNKSLIQKFDVIIVDECHGAKATVLKDILSKFGKNISIRFGVTGTLPKNDADRRTVQCSLGKLLYEIKAHELIDEGYLSNLRIDAITLKVDLSEQYNEYLEFISEDYPITANSIPYEQFKREFFEEWQKEKSYLQGMESRTEWISDKISSVSKKEKGNVLCLVNSIKYGKKLAKMIPGSIFLHGKDKMKIRQEAYSLFNDNNDVIVIATIQIASTGLDIPRIFHLFYIDVGKSFIRTIQTIGRGLRKALDKNFVNVYDICSDTKYSRRHYRERIKYYKEAKYPYVEHVVEYY